MGYAIHFDLTSFGVLGLERDNLYHGAWNQRLLAFNT
jgi:hypothetical protein